MERLRASSVRLSMTLGTALLASYASLQVASRATASDWPGPARLWQPDTRSSVEEAMRQVGAAARLGQSVPASSARLLKDVSRRNPLAPEPFLVEGVRAQIARDDRRAEKLFEAARRRDPRGAAARYFLADRYLRTGRLNQGLVEISALVRLMPAATAAFVPVLVEFAEQPGAAAPLSRFFKQSPQLRDPVLQALAEQTSNGELLVTLDDPHRSTETPAPWKSTIVTKLIEGGEGERALALWSRLSGVIPNQGIFNPQFRALQAPPPFNWRFDEGANSLVTPGAGGLRVIYYSREKTILAEQVLVLGPGDYSLSTRMRGKTPSEALAWHLECYSSKSFLVAAKLAPTSAPFRVPKHGCPLQKLSLRASPAEQPTEVSLAIDSVRLVRRGD